MSLLIHVYMFHSILYNRAKCVGDDVSTVIAECMYIFACGLYAGEFYLL